MNPQYWLGLRAVLTTVAAAALLSTFVPPPRARRAAMDLSDSFPPLPAFKLTERSGREVASSELETEPWIAGFIFTRCSSTCPRITNVMKGMQDTLADGPIRLVSITVDPENDTPEVLTRYARSFDASPERWLFLTGSDSTVLNLVRKGFKLSVAPVDPLDPQYKLMSISHSSRLALVDRGNRVIGLYNAEDPAEVSALIARARRLERPWIGRLPTINAGLNATSTILLLLALIAVRSGRIKLHISLMISALVVSAAFLACYLLYHALIGGGVAFQGSGPVRWVYFTILISHVVLAAAVVPLIFITVVRAARRRFESHRRIARVTFPVWLYVSVTGVVVYYMLYHLDVTAAGKAIALLRP